MIKTAEPNSTAANSDSSEVKPKKEVNPSNQFIGASLNMGWQLAIVVLIPIVGGYKLDEHFNTGPIWTLVGFVLAMLGTYFIIKRTFNEFNKKVYKKGDK